VKIIHEDFRFRSKKFRKFFVCFDVTTCVGMQAQWLCAPGKALTSSCNVSYLFVSPAFLLSSSWGKLKFEILKNSCGTFCIFWLDFRKKIQIFTTFLLEKIFENSFFSSIGNGLKR